jgi:hypothetical protein
MIARFGTAELYGFDLAALPPERIHELSTAKNKDVPCPFKPQETNKPPPKCSKKGGVCSLRQYARDDSGTVSGIGALVTTCPQRFLEKNLIFEWVGDTLLGTKAPVVVSELPFLMAKAEAEDEEAGAVGKIDKVLVSPEGAVLRWCALDMQAVYFSGKSMENDFQIMRTWTGPGVPFPRVQRRPDFRSSGPKRLMPQLQIKVPTISRWGKKTFVTK